MTRVVLFGSYDARLHPRVATLREGLAASTELTEVNEPLGLSTADKIDAASSAAGASRLLRSICRSWVQLLRRGRRVATPDVVVVGYLGHFDVHLARLLWPSSTIVLDHLVGLADTSRDRGVAKGAKAGVLELLDRAALRRADVVVVDTQEQLDLLPAAARRRSVIVPVGATRTWFEQQPPPGAPPVRVCFIGLFTPLHGAPVIGRTLALLADDDRFEFTMVGSGQDREATQAAASENRRVTWVDWVDSESLPALVASHHVGLGVFGTTPKALRVVPTKVYQSLAAGNVVVTSDTAPQRRALGDAARFVPPGDAEGLAAELRAVAGELLDSGDAFTEARRVTAERFAPETVVEPLVAALARVPARRAPLLRRALARLPRRLSRRRPDGGRVAADAGGAAEA